MHLKYLSECHQNYETEYVRQMIKLRISYYQNSGTVSVFHMINLGQIKTLVLKVISYKNIKISSLIY